MIFLRKCLLLPFFLLIAQFQVAKAQRTNVNKLITVQANDSSLAFFLEEISTKAGINFAINLERVNVAQKLSIDFVNIAVREVVDSICSQLNLDFKVLKKQIIIRPHKRGSVKQNKSSKDNSSFTISGYIKDDENGEILIGATVYIKELGLGTTTNSYGFYALTMPRGDYTLQYGFLGFKQQVLNIELLKDLVENVALSGLQIALKEVEIRDETEEMVFIKNQMALINFTADEVEETPGFMGESEVIKSLQNYPGIKSHGDGSMFFYVRGGNKDQNLILIDEAPVYTPSHLFGFFSSFIPEAIKDVNVYKSDIPLSLGGTLSSVIDIKTREGNLKKTGFEGSLGLISNRFILDGPIFKEKVSYFVSLRRSSPIFKGFDFSDFNFKINWKINQNNRIYLAAYSGKDDFRNFGGGDSNIGLKWENATVTLRWNHLFGRKLFSNTTFYSSRYDYFLITDRLNSRNWNEQITNGALKVDFTWYANNSNTVKFGIGTNGYFFNPGNLNFSNIKGPPRKNANQAIFYAANSQKVGRKLKLDYGFRLNSWQNIGSVDTTAFLVNENHEVYDTIYPANGSIYNTYANLEPRFSVSYLIDSISALKLSYSRNVQYVQLLSNSISPFTSADVWVPGSPNIKPQRARQVSLGYSRLLGARKIQTGAEVYYKHMTNQVEFKDHANILLNPAIDAELRFGTANAYGLELCMEKNTAKIHWQIGYSYARVFKKIKGINNNEKYPALYDKPHQLSASLGYKISSRVSFSAAWNYTTGGAYTTPTGFYYENGKQVPIYEKRNNDRLPDYHRLDLALKWRLNKSVEKRFQHHLNFSVFNFYGRKNPFALSYGKEKIDRNIFKVPINALSDKNLVNSMIYFGGPIPTVSYNFKF